MNNNNNNNNVEEAACSWSEEDEPELQETVSKKRPLGKAKGPAKKRPRESPAVGWMITINNYTEQDIVTLEEFAAEHCKYMIYQEEEGEEQGTPHIQCYFELRRKNRFTWIINNLELESGQPHLEKRRESRAACIKYCSKTKTRKAGCEYHVIGNDKTDQGKRNDITRVYELAKSNAKTSQYMEEVPGTYLRYHKGIEKVKAVHSNKRDFQSSVFVLIGDSDTGKSRLAMQFPNVYKCPVSYNGLWFDGYDPEEHETVLFDDFYGKVAWTELLQMLDRYAHQVNVKGGYVNFKPKYIVFTSNVGPEGWYPKMCQDKNRWPALQRRLHTIIKFIKHPDGVDHRFLKGVYEDLPEGVELPPSVPIPMRLQNWRPKVAPKHVPKIQPKRPNARVDDEYAQLMYGESPIEDPFVDV